MAISVFHNPSDNKLHRLVQVSIRRFLQLIGLILGVIADLLCLSGSSLLRLLKQFLAMFCRLGT